MAFVLCFLIIKKYELLLSAEDQLLRKVILNTKCNTVQFKLAPTYTLYLAIRHRLSNAYYPDLPPQERALRLTNFINKISGIMQQAIEVSTLFFLSNTNSCLIPNHFCEKCILNFFLLSPLGKP